MSCVDINVIDYREDSEAVCPKCGKTASYVYTHYFHWFRCPCGWEQEPSSHPSREKALKSLNEAKPV